MLLFQDPPTDPLVLLALQIGAGIFLSAAANRLIEYGVTPYREWYLNKHGAQPDLWWLLYVSWAIGAALSAGYGLNFVPLLMPFLPQTPAHLVLGQILTAAAVGGGSNLIYEIFGAIKRVGS